MIKLVLKTLEDAKHFSGKVRTYSADRVGGNPYICIEWPITYEDFIKEGEWTDFAKEFVQDLNRKEDTRSGQNRDGSPRENLDPVTQRMLFSIKRTVPENNQMGLAAYEANPIQGLGELVKELYKGDPIKVGFGVVHEEQAKALSGGQNLLSNGVQTPFQLTSGLVNSYNQLVTEMGHSDWAVENNVLDLTLSILGDNPYARVIIDKINDRYERAIEKLRDRGDDWSGYSNLISAEKWTSTKEVHKADIKHNVNETNIYLEQYIKELTKAAGVRYAYTIVLDWDPFFKQAFNDVLRAADFTGEPIDIVRKINDNPGRFKAVFIEAAKRANKEIDNYFSIQEYKKVRHFTAEAYEKARIRAIQLAQKKCHDIWVTLVDRLYVDPDVQKTMITRLSAVIDYTNEKKLPHSESVYKEADNAKEAYSVSLAENAEKNIKIRNNFDKEIIGVQDVTIIRKIVDRISSLFNSIRNKIESGAIEGVSLKDMPVKFKLNTPTDKNYFDTYKSIQEQLDTIIDDIAEFMNKVNFEKSGLVPENASIIKILKGIMALSNKLKIYSDAFNLYLPTYAERMAKYIQETDPHNKNEDIPNN